MKNKKLLLALKILFLGIFIQINIGMSAQSDSLITVLLNRVEGVGPFFKNIRVINKETDSSGFTGMPKKADQSAFFKTSFHLDQNIFDRFRNSLPISKFEKARLEGIDTNKLSKEKITHSISIFSGIVQGKKVIIFDTNQNNNFSDDFHFEFDLNLYSKEESYWDNRNTTVILNFARFNPDQGKAVQKNVIAKIYPFNNYDVNDKLSFSLLSFEHRLGKFSFRNKEFTLAVATLGPFTDDFSNIELIPVVSETKFNTTQNRTGIGGIIRLAEQDFLVERMTPLGDTLFLKLTKPQPAKPKTGLANQIIAFEEKDINGELIKSQNYSSQYLLLNFWGTWCSPCVKKIPWLNDLQNSAAAKNLKIIGIAKDADEAALKNFILENEIQWTNIFENFTDFTKDSPTQLFEVSVYPTMILYLPDGNGIIKATTPEETDQLQSYLENLK